MDAKDMKVGLPAIICEALTIDEVFRHSQQFTQFGDPGSTRIQKLEWRLRPVSDDVG